MGISPVVAGDAYDHKGSARPAVGYNEVGKGLSVFLRVPKKILSAVEQFDVETRDSHKICIMCAGFDSFRGGRGVGEYHDLNRLRAHTKTRKLST
jgi:hypothetical protein